MVGDYDVIKPPYYTHPGEAFISGKFHVLPMISEDLKRMHLYAQKEIGLIVQ